MKKSGSGSSGNMSQTETTVNSGAGRNEAVDNEGNPMAQRGARTGLGRRFSPPGPAARPLLALDLDDILRRIEERLADLEIEESEEDDGF